jgi:alkylation response protein AidB-like acyl-CoA dehydrogenase
MNFALSDEQQFLQQAAGQALSRHDTLEAARAALDGAAPPSLWATACEAGWPGLMAGDDVDGAELGALEAMLVLEACGGALADAHLLGHLPATALLEAAGGEVELRSALASGERRAAFVDGAAESGLTSAGSGDELRLNGTVESVTDAVGADVLVVCAHDDAGAVVAAVVDPRDPAVHVEAVASYDGSRSLARVRLTDAPARPVAAGAEAVADARNLQRALLGAEQLGAAQACLTMARDYAADRIAFGRPIGSYQAIKHKLVEMLRKVENARSLTYYAGWAWTSRREEFALAANTVRVAGGEALDYAAPENIFIHGGVGATWEHDASLYYRRAELSRRLLGGSDRAADSVAEELLRKEAA